MKRNAFTIAELMIGIMIISITATVVIVNVNAVSGQTAKREAEKLAHWLVTRMSIADSQNRPFKLQVNADKVFVHWGPVELYESDKEYFDSNKGCTFQLFSPNGYLQYDPESNTFKHQGGHITVTGKEGVTAPYYVIIATIGDRVRVSDTAP